MDSVADLYGLERSCATREEHQRAAVMKTTFKTMHHYFGGFSPCILRGH